MKTQFDIPKEINILLRRFAMETERKSRENAILYIITNYLVEYYKLKKEEKK